MKIKYDIEFSEATLHADVKRLINQLWKLIPMRENAEDWRGHLAVLTEEIAGLNALIEELQLLILLSKLEGLTSSVCDDFMLYRKTVFKCIDLLTKAVNVNE